MGFLIILLKEKKTLLYPYILWCFIWFVFILTIQSIPFFKPFFGIPLSSLAFGELIKQLFYYPLNYPFWFLRELMLFVLLTPLIYFTNKKGNVLLLVVVFISSLFYKSFLSIDSLGIALIYSESLFYFMLGAFLGINKYLPIWKANMAITLIMLIVWLLSNFLYVNIIETQSFLKILLLYFKNIIGIVALWQLYDCTVSSNEKLPYFYKYSFFIFAFHGIPVNYIGQILVLILPNNIPMLNFGVYLFSFILALIVSVLVANLLDKKFNKIYRILTGSR